MTEVSEQADRLQRDAAMWLDRITRRATTGSETPATDMSLVFVEMVVQAAVLRISERMDPRVSQQPGSAE
jgi:hypothetical protein